MVGGLCDGSSRLGGPYRDGRKTAGTGSLLSPVQKSNEKKAGRRPPVTAATRRGEGRRSQGDRRKGAGTDRRSEAGEAAP